jgi:uncharacterized protein with HEPN domain
MDRIHEMIIKIYTYSHDHRSYESFMQDEESVDACIFCIAQIWEICGQMSKLYPDALDLQYSKIVWMRNLLIHTYHHIDREIIWKTI